MRILLCYPQYTHSSEFDSRAPSMSLVYLASTLEAAGHKVTIYDASLGPIRKTGNVFRYGVSDDEMRSFLSSNPFDVIAITCSFTARFRFVSKIARIAKEISPESIVCTGGLFPTSKWLYCLDNCRAIDFIILGEGELSLASVIKNIEQGKSVKEACSLVEGTAWREGDKNACNPKQEYNDELDKLPFPAWHLAGIDKYFSLQRKIFELPAPCLPILSSRSCPNQCRFCNMYITHGRRFRMRSAENVLDEIEYLINKFNVRHFYFVDDNFSLNPVRAKKILKGIMERGLHVKYNFHNGLSIKTLDRELISLMKKSGCTSVCLAIESGSERIRNEVYGKNLSTKKIFDVFKWCREEGIPTIGYFMVGAPGETRTDFEESKKLLLNLPMSLATVGIYTPYPDTELYDECKDKGWLKEPSTDDENRVEMFSSMLKTPDFNPEDVAAWQKELYISFLKGRWPVLVKEALRPWGVVNLDMVGKFFGMMKFRNRAKRCMEYAK